MSGKFVNFTEKNSIAKLTLNRPKVLNSFNSEMAAEMQEHLDNIKYNPKLRSLSSARTEKDFVLARI